MKLKKLFLITGIIFTIALFCGITVNAATYSGNCGDNGDNVTWKLDTSTGVLNINGTGDMEDYGGVDDGNSSAPWDTYKTYIKTIVINENVTNIGSYAFYNCKSLKSITIPDSVTSIGGLAFYDCSNIKVYITDVSSWCKINFTTGSNPLAYSGSNLYLNGEILSDIIIPDDVDSINGNVFAGYKGLRSVVIPSTTIGSSAFASCSNLVSVTLSDSVTSIGFRAFGNCTSLTSITIPDSVTSIGGAAFENCTSLKNISLGIGVTSIGKVAFKQCTALEYIDIPDGVSEIAKSTFEKCTSLKSISLPGTLTMIYSYAFDRCNNLTDIYYRGVKDKWNTIRIVDEIPATATIHFWSGGTCGNNLTWTLDYNNTLIVQGTGDMYDSAISSWLKANTIIIGYGVTSIGDNAFYNCSSLTSITIPDSVTSIGSSAFYGCDSLTSITIPDSVTSIGRNAFYNCSSLTSITIPDSVTSISYRAFYNCYSLASITIPDSVTSIGEYAFYGCDSLTDVYIMSMEAWCDITFSSSSSNPLWKAGNLYLNGEIVVELTIPNSVTSIGNYAFYNCSSLTSITIPDSVTSIGDWAFYYCDSLTSITIPDSVTSISYCAFYNCYSLASITIPDSVTSIVIYAFYGCDSLTDVYYSGSEDDWKAINIGDRNNDLTNATIHYNYVPGKVESITLNLSNKSLYIGDSLTIIATVSPNNATDKSVTWSSSDDAVATVENGIVKALGIGTATITATTIDGGHTASCTIAVVPKPAITQFDVNTDIDNLAIINISTENLPDNCVIFVAAYKDGLFSQIKPIPVGKNGTFFVTDGENVFKVFVWDSLNSMRSICDSVEKK